MSISQVLEIQQGIWIAEHWLESAGLGPRIRVVAQTGEIRIFRQPEIYALLAAFGSASQKLHLSGTV